jgi:hypothetical protein
MMALRMARFIIKLGSDLRKSAKERVEIEIMHLDDQVII